MKIVINTRYGGYGLSEKALATLGTRTSYSIARHDPRLVELVERDPVAAAGRCAKLGIVEIPDNATDFWIDEYDGIESVIYVTDGRLHRANYDEDDD